MGKIRTYFELVTFSHSVFALPFALLSMITAAKGIPEFKIILLILIAMISARTSAMAFNRLSDADIDKENPRTQNRHIPSGKISKSEVIILIIVSSSIFIISAYLLNWLCFILSPVALLIVLLYSYSKRFTNFSHLWLGLSLAIAPVGSWIAVKGEIGTPSLILGIAVIFWVAGFDIIYSVQDYNFDIKRGLHSLVIKLGIQNALYVSRIFHGLTLSTLFVFSYITSRGAVFNITLIVIVFLLLYEHSLVKPDKLDRINLAFFTVNGAISVILLLAGSIDISLGLR